MAMLNNQMVTWTISYPLCGYHFPIKGWNDPDSLRSFGLPSRLSVGGGDICSFTKLYG
jgi:hypothetical protein